MAVWHWEQSVKCFSTPVSMLQNRGLKLSRITNDLCVARETFPFLIWFKQRRSKKRFVSSVILLLSSNHNDKIIDKTRRRRWEIKKKGIIYIKNTHHLTLYQEPNVDTAAVKLPPALTGVLYMRVQFPCTCYWNNFRRKHLSPRLKALKARTRVERHMFPAYVSSSQQRSRKKRADGLPWIRQETSKGKKGSGRIDPVTAAERAWKHFLRLFSLISLL